MSIIKDLDSLLESKAKEKNALRNRIDATKSKKLTKKVSELADRYFAIIEDEKDLKEAKELLDICLKQQREISTSFDELDLINSNNVSNINSRIRKRPSKRFYNLQEVLCDKQDFLIIKGDEKLTVPFENALIERLIINPEMISDELLVSLWLVKENFYKLSYAKKLKIKISLLSKFKKILSNTTPLNIWQESEANTWRIMVCNHKSEASNGDILLIQNTDSLEENADYKKKVLCVHDNIYSFIRSQNHTIESIKEKERLLSKIYDTLKSIKFWLLKWTKHSKDMALILLSKQINSLKRFRWFRFENCLNQLKTIEWKDALNDWAKINYMLEAIDWKLKTLISQKNTISKHVDNIHKITHNSEINWNILRKNYKELARKLEKNGASKHVLEYINQDEEFKKSFKGTSEDLIFEISHWIEVTILQDLDEQAKQEAYLWSEIDSKNGIDTSSKPYQDHQYFEALKQKREYYKKGVKLDEKRLWFVLDMHRITHARWYWKTIESILELLKVFLSSKWDFCPYPYSKVYDNIWYEKKRLKKAFENNDPIETYRTILSILITIKEYDVLIYLSRLEWNKEISKIKQDAFIREKFENATNQKIGNLLKRDFLKDIDFPIDSHVHRRFLTFLKILNTVKAFMAKWRSDELINYIKSLRLKKIEI